MSTEYIITVVSEAKLLADLEASKTHSFVEADGKVEPNSSKPDHYPRCMEAQVYSNKIRARRDIVPAKQS
jgi:hypothetical protein